MLTVAKGIFNQKQALTAHEKLTLLRDQKKLASSGAEIIVSHRRRNKRKRRKAYQNKSEGSDNT